MPKFLCFFIAFAAAAAAGCEARAVGVDQDGGPGTDGARDARADATSPRPDARVLPDAVTECHETQCPTLPPPPDPRMEFMQHCCTADEQCGAAAPRLFGDACFERDQPGELNPSCPWEEILVMMDLSMGLMDYLEGCCRPDGRCGLWTDYMGAGCVERGQFGAALEQGTDGYNQENDIDPLPCTPGP